MNIIFILLLVFFLTISGAVILSLFSIAKDNEGREPPIHIYRHLKEIEKNVQKSRQSICYDDLYDSEITSISITYGIHAVFHITPVRERFVLVCNQEGERFAHDLQKWLREYRALSFDVNLVVNYDERFPSNREEA